MASIIPTGLTPVAYNPGLAGAKPRSIPVTLAKASTQDDCSKIVPIIIPWASAPYNASSLIPAVAVLVSMLGANVDTPLDTIRSVYVDNSQSITPIFVEFPDTGFLIQCPARSVSWQPVPLTQGTPPAVKVYGVGFITNIIPTTTLFFTNIAVSGYVIPVSAANLVRGKWNSVGNVAAGGTAVSVALANNNATPATPDRIVCAIISGQGAAAMAWSAFTINGVAATIIGNTTIGALNNAAMIYARVPATNRITVAFTSSTAASGVLVSAWAIYNASQLAPIDTNFLSFNAALATAFPWASISPFLTQDGFCCLGAFWPTTAAAPAGVVTWQGREIINATQSVGGATNGFYESAASMNGFADEYEIVTANLTGDVNLGAPLLCSATWN